jgi:hypothetical protein
MRRSYLVPFLLVTLPLVAAQDVKVDDPAGDVQVLPGGPAFDFVDLLAVSVELNATHIVTHLTPASRDNDATGVYHDPEYWVEFGYRSDVMRILIRPTARSGGDPTTGDALVDFSSVNLYRRAADSWTSIWQGDVTSSHAEDFVSAAVPLDAIVSADDFTFSNGGTLELLSYGSYWDTESNSMHDLQPSGPISQTDLGEFPSTLLAAPSIDSGNVQMLTSRPLRFSNGEATTYHWLIEADTPHLGNYEVNVNARPGLQVRAPRNIDIDGADTAFSVFVTVPFAHVHGVQDLLQVQLIDNAGDVSEIEIGIIYPTTPQLSGHHPEVWLHSNGVRHWLNTSNSDVDVEAVGRLGNCITSQGSHWGVNWFYPLDPHMLMGLDARIGEPGQLAFALESTLPIQDGAIHAKLLLYNVTDAQNFPLPREFYDIHQEDKEAAAQTITGLSTSLDVNLALPMPAKLDYVDVTSETNLALVILYCPASPLDEGFNPIAYLNRETGNLRLLPDASMTLPLNDFHDGLELENGGGTARLESLAATVHGPPGGRVQWTVAISAAEDQEVDIMLLGSSAHLASIVSKPSSIRSTAQSIIVEMALPDDARQGEVHEIVVVATALGQDSAIRLAAVVNVDAPEHQTTLDEQGTPALGRLALMGGLLLAAILRRRAA